MQAAGPAWLGSSVRYHGPEEAPPLDRPIPTRAKEPTVTLSSSGAQDLREPPLHRPHVQTGMLRPESKLRERPDPYIPLQSSPAPEATSPGPQPSPHSLPSVAGTACPCLPSAHSRKPPGRNRGSFLSLEKPHCSLHHCAKGLWLRAGPGKAHLPHPCGGGSSLPTALISTWRDIQW